MSKVKITRSELVAALVERDGLVCAYPGEAHLLDLNGTGKNEVTIDHWYAQSKARLDGWTEEEIWDLSNLRLMCKKHNAQKSDILPLEDGTLPVKAKSRFRYRRDKRAQRAEICTECNAGRNLGPSEVCAACGSGPMPERFPRWAKVSSAECDHELFWCWACSIGIIERPAAIGTAMRQADSDELGEW